MRYLMFGVAIAAVAAGASAQEARPNWNYFEQPNQPIQAGVVAANGAQLILKCDKPGKKSVYAVVVVPENLVPPSTSGAYQMRVAEFRFDDLAPVEDRWRFYDHSAVAIDEGRSNSMTRFLAGLRSGGKLRVRLNPERARWVEANFEVGGAQDALTRVYESCKDELPAS